MKKLLIVGLVMILALSVLVGCTQKKPPVETPPADKPAETAMESPAETPAETPGETPDKPVEGGAEAKPLEAIPYLVVETLYAEDAAAKEDAFKKADTSKIPEGAKVVAMKLKKSETAPEDKEVAFILLEKEGRKEVKKNTVNSKDLKDKDVFCSFAIEKAGPYIIEITEVGTDNKAEIEIEVEGPAGDPGDVKSDEPGMEKEGAPAGATDAPGTEKNDESGDKAPEDKPADAPATE